MKSKSIGGHQSTVDATGTWFTPPTKSKLKKKEDDYYICKRCKISSLDTQMCPCPRGGCEALISGTIITTEVFDPVLTEDQKEWNKNR